LVQAFWPNSEIKVVVDMRGAAKAAVWWWEKSRPIYPNSGGGLAWAATASYKLGPWQVLPIILCRRTPLKPVLTLALACSLGLATLACQAADNTAPTEPRNSAWLDAHANATGFWLVARAATPSLPREQLQAALSTAARDLCPHGQTRLPLTEGRYETLQPASDAPAPWRSVVMADLLAAQVDCPSQRQAPARQAGLPAPAAPTPPAVPRLAVGSSLPEQTRYLEQGFTTFNRERAEVPLAAGTLQAAVAQAVQQALVARGYAVQTTVATQPANARLQINPAPVPGERFDGQAWLTKIGVLRIQRSSSAMSSVQLVVAAAEGAAPAAPQVISTRQDGPALYKRWEADMAPVPPDALHQRASAQMIELLQAQVRAAVHALPAAAVRQLLRE
jgi:hypothetical protein